ncbi:hypothetical protein [Paenibacillus sp. OSY-SE]|uniref:hypothetical protein n=1 Tax=Paenibacillus sp. OSY-SE TaxID=1196323 RepID=UPI00030CEC0E|nr:hypothetical protein [Paenibacillus sp. OSY-SE]
MKAATKVAIATLSGILLLGSSVNLAAEAASSQPAKKTAAKEAANKAQTAEEKKFIESEITRVKELPKEPGDIYVMYFKYKQLNYGFDFLPFGKDLEYSTYEDYF